MNRSKNDLSPFSNAYDIAQEAMLFLCQHIGEKLGDICITKYGKAQQLEVRDSVVPTIICKNNTHAI